VQAGEVSSTSRQSNGLGLVFAATINAFRASRPATVAADLASSQRLVNRPLSPDPLSLVADFAQQVVPPSYISFFLDAFGGASVDHAKHTLPLVAPR
jgi:hypothetical protein